MMVAVTSNAVRSVMFVDDEPALRLLAVRKLGKLGFEVTAFGDAATALDAARSAALRPAIAFADVQMIPTSGWELARQLRAVDAFLPIVLMTGQAVPGDDARACEVGARFLMQKPVVIDDLWAEVRRLIDELAR